MEDNAEIAAPLLRGGLDEAVDVFQKGELWLLSQQDVVYLPPKDAFLPLDSFLVGQASGDRIVLAGEAGRQQVEIGD